MKILSCIFVIIGVIIGAGFASGKEIYIFFFVYGKKGIVRHHNCFYNNGIYNI